MIRTEEISPQNFYYKEINVKTIEPKSIEAFFWDNMSEDSILYEVRGKTTIITLNIPSKLNALTQEEYLELAKLMEEADKEEETVVTIIQATGRYFSAGANVAGGSLSNKSMSELMSHEHWLSEFVARNVYITDIFHNHSKVLVASLNGPVIGLSAALVCLCDLIYVNDEEKFFLMTPFANLGLVTEGALSATLFMRLGWSKASEALLLAKPIQGTDLLRLGVINKSYRNYNFKSTEEFNQQVFKDIDEQIAQLYYPSIIEMKQLLKANRDSLINSASAREVIKGFNKWIQGIPQQRFAAIVNKEIKHKF